VSAKGAVATEVRIDQPARALLAVAQACQADCVAVGRHRHRGRDEAILGALAEHATRHAAGDVLVVP